MASAAPGIVVDLGEMEKVVVAEATVGTGDAASVVQSPRLQLAVSVKFPTQLCASVLHTRIRILDPGPHDTEQGVHGDQSPQPALGSPVSAGRWGKGGNGEEGRKLGAAGQRPCAVVDHPGRTCAAWATQW